MVAARISRLVSWPSCRKASSGKPGAVESGAAPGSATHSIASVWKSSTAPALHSSAVASTRRSRAPPMRSRAIIRLGP